MCDVELTSYREQLNACFKNTSLFIIEKAYYDLWYKRSRDKNMYNGEVRAAILFDLTRRYWLESHICVSSSLDIEGLLKEFASHSMSVVEQEHFPANLWTEKSINNWISFAVYDPKFGTTPDRATERNSNHGRVNFQHLLEYRWCGPAKGAFMMWLLTGLLLRPLV